MKRLVATLFFAWMFTVLALSAHAQLSTATMFGSVTDSTGGGIPSATVTLTQTDTKFTRTITTKGDGSYRADFIPVGPYHVSVKAAGFKTLEREGITLTVTEQAKVDLSLQPGGESTVVEVTGEVPLVNTGNSTLGRTVDNVEIDNLPLVDRNVYQLLDLTPGVQNNNGLNNNQSSTNGGNAFLNLGYPEQHVVINGSTDSLVGQVSYYLDGGSNMTGIRNTGNPLPNPDAIREFRVDTSNFSAQYGRSSAGVVTVLTKSGTNQFHGSLFEFFRDRNFNATEHNISPSLGKTPYNQHRFGGTVGGPIRRDRTFFFGSYAGYRFVSSSILVSQVPSAAMQMGNFGENLPTTGLTGTAACAKSVTSSTTKFYVCNPVTRSAYPGNIVPVTDFDPTIYNIIKAGLIPTPHNGGQPGDSIYTARDFQRFTQRTDEQLLKGEHQISSKQRLVLSYFHQTGDYVVNPSGNNILNWTTHDYSFIQHNANIQHVWTLTNNTVNQLYLGYTRLLGSRVATPAHSLAAFGSKFAEQLPDGSICGTADRTGCSLAQLQVSGWFQAGNANTGPVTGDNVYLARDVVSSTHGKHTLYIGGEGSLEKDAQQVYLNNYGVFAFTAASAGTAGRTSAAITDFFFGRPNTMNQDVPVYANANYWNYGAFFQDDWRITPTLTLNLGIRYDVQTAPLDTQRRTLNFKAGVQSTVDPTAPVGVLFAGDPGVPEGGTSTKYDHVSPRVGFAWNPYGDGKTVIHGAAGIFFGTVGGNLFGFPSNGEPFSGRPQFKKVISVNDPYTGDPSEFCANPNGGCATGTSPYPYVYSPSNIKFLVYPAPIIAFDSNFAWPVIYQVTFGFQQQFTKSFALSANYVGAFTRKAPIFNDINYPIYTPGAPSSAPTTAPAKTIGANYPNTTTYTDNRRPFNQPGAPGASPSGAASPIYSSVSVIQSTETSNYHALQISAEQRFVGGFSINGFYVWSKTLASAALDETGNVGNNAATAFEDSNLRYLDKQRSDFDQRHVAVISFVYKPNYGLSNRLERLAVNGWTVTSIIRMQSGAPFNITTGVDTNADGNNYDRPNVLNGLTVHANDNGHSRVAMETNWVSISSFCQPDRVTPISATANNPACPQLGAGPGGIDGTLRDNSVDAPGRRDVDASIFRDFPLYHDRVTFQLRGEANNVFNLTNLPAPSSTLSGGIGSFGHINGTIQSSNFSNRVLQVGGRILF